MLHLSLRVDATGSGARLRRPACAIGPECGPVASRVSIPTKAGQIPNARGHILFPAFDGGLCEHGVILSGGGIELPILACSLDTQPIRAGLNARFPHLA